MGRKCSGIAYLHCEIVQRKNVATGSILANNFTYEAANAIINKNEGNWVWNVPGYHRSYWAVSPAYFVNKYPEVASDVDESNNLEYIVPGATDDTKYQWKSIDAPAQYYREATVGDDALKSANPAAAVASVILKGYYTINDVRKDFYTYQKNGNVWYVFLKEKASATATDLTMMDRFMQLQSVMYKKASDGSYDRLTKDDLTAYSEITIQHPDKSVLELNNKEVEGGEILKVASRKQTLQLTKMPAQEMYYTSGSGYTKVDESNWNDVNMALIHQLGFANYYDKGNAYFNIPIKHLGWYRTTNTQKDATNIDWNKVRVGDFGMVRNHAYDIKVTEIKGLGVGIGDMEDPIIPPAETQDYYVKYEVRCLKWAIVDTQEVKL